MGKVFNFGWSFSKDGLFRECERAFFFHYAHKDEPFGRDAHRLKELKTPLMMAGTVVDTVIGKALVALKEGGEVRTELATKGEKAYEYIWTKSADLGPKTRTGKAPPENAIILHHHYFDHGDDDADKKAGLRTVRTCLENFEGSGLWQTLQRMSGLEWGEIRTHGDGKFPPKFRMDNGIAFWAAYDFYIKEPPKLHILDWKSGKKCHSSQQKAKQQLAIYSLYGQKALSTDLENVTAQAIWLADEPEWAPEQVDGNLIAGVAASVTENAEKVFARLVEDGDYKGRPIYEASAPDFPPAPDMRKCGRCRFLSICEEGREAVAGKVVSDDFDDEEPFEPD